METSGGGRESRVTTTESDSGKMESRPMQEEMTEGKTSKCFR